MAHTLLFFNLLYTKIFDSIKDVCRYLLQNMMSSLFYPARKQDWYRQKGYGNSYLSAFDDFVYQNCIADTGLLADELHDIRITRHQIPTTLTLNRECVLDAIQLYYDEDQHKLHALPASEQHIVLFLGRGAYFEQKYREMARQLRTTGATIWAFNFPGVNASTGKILELDDLVRSGISLVNYLINIQNIPTNSIVLQGNCLGSGVLEYVAEHFKQQNIYLRKINSNGVKSFKSGVYSVLDMYHLSPLKCLVKPLLAFTRWRMQAGKLYCQSSPYAIYMNRYNDGIINAGTLKLKVDKYKQEMLTGITQSSKRTAIEDKCAENYKTTRDHFDSLAEVYVMDEHKDAVYANTNHFALLYQLETKDGEPVMEAIIKEYLIKSYSHVSNKNV